MQSCAHGCVLMVVCSLGAHGWLQTWPTCMRFFASAAPGPPCGEMTPVPDCSGKKRIMRPSAKTPLSGHTQNLGGSSDLLFNSTPPLLEFSTPTGITSAGLSGHTECWTDTTMPGCCKQYLERSLILKGWVWRLSYHDCHVRDTAHGLSVLLQELVKVTFIPQQPAPSAKRGSLLTIGALILLYRAWSRGAITLRLNVFQTPYHVYIRESGELSGIQLLIFDQT